MKHNFIKLALLIVAMFVGVTSAFAAGDLSTARVGFLVLDNASEQEGAALVYITEEYPNIQPITTSEIGTINTFLYDVIWVHIDRTGLERGHANLPLSTETVAALTTFAANGGNLYLSGQATQLLVSIGRIEERYAPNIYNNGAGGDDETDIWTVNAYICQNLAEEFRQDQNGHPVYKDMILGDYCGYPYQTYPIEGRTNSESGIWRENHNCMWDFNLITATGDNNIRDFQNQTNSVVLGTWGHVVDAACAGIIEFKPTEAVKGRIIANGMAAFQWYQKESANDFQSNLEKFTTNALSYLAPVVPTPAATTTDLATAKIGFLITETSEENISAQEKAALSLFRFICPAGEVILDNESDKINVDNFKAIWVHVDRTNSTISMTELFDAATITALGNYLKAGGGLFLSKHATQLITHIGRIKPEFAPTIIGSGDGSASTGIWGINANIVGVDHFDHPIYRNMLMGDTFEQPRKIIPFEGTDNGSAMWREDHNCKWDFNHFRDNNYFTVEGANNVVRFEAETNSVVLGAWGHVIDDACFGIIEFLPTETYKGRVIANGMAAYELFPRQGSNSFQGNITQHSINTLNYFVEPNIQTSVIENSVSNDATIYSTGNTIRVAGVEGNAAVAVYAIDGRLVAQQNIDGEGSIAVSTEGIVIVKLTSAAGTTAKKVIIK